MSEHHRRAIDVDEKRVRAWFLPLYLARQAYRLLMFALVNCMNLPGAWSRRVVAALIERALRGSGNE